jgi:hypothetical protein
MGPTQKRTTNRPNIVYFLVDNLGVGELSSYSGGPLRGVITTRIDAFAQEGMMLLAIVPYLLLRGPTNRLVRSAVAGSTQKVVAIRLKNDG